MAWRRGQTYSQDLRDRVLRAETLTARQAAERFGVSVSYVVKARQRLARAGAATPRPQKPSVARKLVPFHGALQERVARVPDATLAGHREWLAETHGVIVGLTTIWKALKHLKLTLKKVAQGDRTEPARCRGGPATMDCPATRTGPEAPGLPRRDLGQDKHDAALWPQPARHSLGRYGAVWALENDDVPGRVAARRDRRAAGARWSDQWRGVPGLDRAVPGAGIAPRRHRDCRQIGQPQGRGRAQGDRGAWGRAAVVATLLARPEPDQAGVRQAETTAAQGRATQPRGAVAHHWREAPYFSPSECLNYLRHCGYGHPA